MDKTFNVRNSSIRTTDALRIAIEEEAFPEQFLISLKQAAGALSVHHEGLFYSLVSSVNYSILHSRVHLDDAEWSEAVVVWNLIVGASGSRKSAIHSLVCELVDESIEVLKMSEDIVIKQWLFTDGSVEKLGCIMSQNHGRISMFHDEASRNINTSSGGKKTTSECNSEAFMLETYNGKKMNHQTMGGANYEFVRCGLIGGGFTQPEVAMQFMMDGMKGATGFLQRYNIHFIKSVYVQLRSLTFIDEKFKHIMVNDVFVPLLKNSFLRGVDCQRYILKDGTKAFDIFEVFYNNIILLKERLSMTNGLDILGAFLGKMEGKVMREACVLTEMLSRFKFAWDKLNKSNKCTVKHSTPKSVDKDEEEPAMDQYYIEDDVSVRLAGDWNFQQRDIEIRPDSTEEKDNTTYDGFSDKISENTFTHLMWKKVI